MADIFSPASAKPGALVSFTTDWSNEIPVSKICVGGQLVLNGRQVRRDGTGWIIQSGTENLADPIEIVRDSNVAGSPSTCTIIFRAPPAPLGSQPVYLLDADNNVLYPSQTNFTILDGTNTFPARAGGS